MKFNALVPDDTKEETLSQEYQSSREIGNVRVGQDNLFFRAKLKKYYIPYRAVGRCYRRVFLVPAKMCCGGGDFQMENLVVWDQEKELAQVPIPSTRAARELMKALKEKMPDVDFSSPAPSQEKEA